MCLVNKAARGSDLTYVTFGPIKNLKEVCFRLSSVYGWTFFNCLIGGGAHKATSVISVEIASDLMPVMKVVPKMPYLLTVASSMYVGRVSPVILYFRGFLCGLTGERKGERLKTIKCCSTGSYEAQRLR